jgi:hypothetical protein
MFSKQRGLSLLSVVFLLIVVGGGLLLGMKITPTVTEYLEIKKALKKAAEKGDTPASVRANFDLIASAGYITSIGGKDIAVTKRGDKVIASVAYQKKIELVSPVSLVIDYEASSE